MNGALRTLLLLVLIPVCGITQESQKQLSSETDSLAQGLYRIYIGHGGAVIALSGEQGTLLIDDGPAAATAVLKNVLDSLKCPPVRYVINTHWHRDHTGGNSAFGKEATIIAHENVKRLLLEDQALLDRKIPAAPAWALPAITFSERLSLTFDGVEVQVIHLPGGHTDGDAIVWFPGPKVLGAGDLLFADAFPFVDTLHGGNPLQLIKNLKWIVDQYPLDSRIIGGHGRMYSMIELKKYTADLSRTSDVVKRGKSAGMSKEQLKKAGILNEWARYGTWWITEDMWIDTLYGYL
jgi:cyclase